MEVFTALFLRDPRSKWEGRSARFWNLGQGWEAHATLRVERGRDARATLTAEQKRDAYFTLAAAAVLFWPFLALAQTPANAPTSPAAPQLTVVSHLGDGDSALRDGRLLAHHRSTDPLSVPIRGKFRGLPPAVEKPVTSVAQSAAAAAAPAPTLAQAVGQLPVGAVNPNGREMLIASHLVREGDLVVIELGGHRFFVWVQSIDQRGAQFCDLDLKQRALRPFRTGPRELAPDTVEQQPDIQSFLEKNEH